MILCVIVEVTIKQLRERIKELDEKLELTAQVRLVSVAFHLTWAYFSG